MVREDEGCGFAGARAMHETWHGMSIEWATTPWRRFRGLLFGAQCGDILALRDCCDIHTFGMRRPIDVAFVGGTGVVMAAYRDVRAGRRIRCPRAVVVFERYANDTLPWMKRGDVIGARLLRETARMQTRESARNERGRDDAADGCMVCSHAAHRRDREERK